MAYRTYFAPDGHTQVQCCCGAATVSQSIEDFNAGLYAACARTDCLTSEPLSHEPVDRTIMANRRG